MLDAPRKVLIANRGEIAVRVIRACRERGFQTVAVFSDCDRDALHVRLADEAHHIGPSPAVESYLRIDKIVDVALRSRAELVHPGYGFLAENEDFAQACGDAGLTFVGPSPQAIARMGSKTEARRAAVAAGVPVVPGTEAPFADDAPDDAIAKAADRIGYPLVVKAVAGGGGKGMRTVADSRDLANAVRTARSEARAAFGDAAIYLERRLLSPRHIEVQLIADHHGVVVPFVERECSIQRRHQKVVEESPSPVLPAGTRAEMAACAARVAAAVGYTNAGTIEFLVDEEGHFFFLEMNTRLQVEHPVTEEVLGIDLVEQLLRVAAGEALAFTQDDLQPRGHAIELRIYAEDAARGYLPTTGTILALQEPHGAGVRVDSGIGAGQEVTAAFDPMLAKLIVHAATRDAAIALGRQALHDYVLLGCKSNIGFLRRLLAHPAFVAAQIHTGFLDAHPDVAAEPAIEPATLHKLLAVAALSSRPLRDAADAVPALHAAIGAWRN
jgi:propionyl-CoA carboxylase alpha chain/3-methylcrotonyl-CoA carboxylase alpha subunit/acetyl-CoA/propionyl-CoA carboxylase biotin carboxyl carrier protein